MSKKINIEDLKKAVVDEARKEGLESILDSASIDRIAEQIKNIMFSEKVKYKDGGVEILPEIQGAASSFPYQETIVEPAQPQQDVRSVVQQQPIVTQPQQPIVTQQQPKVYVPEIPSSLKNAEPFKLVVNSESDLMDSGENLARKLMRTYDDLDVRKSMMDLWRDEAKLKAEVYIIKYEKAGEIEFNYMNGTAKFTESTDSTPDNPAILDRDNPYMEKSSIGLTRSDVETYLNTSVDIQSMVSNTLKDLIKKTVNEMP
jgi:hypothetical protein